MDTTNCLRWIYGKRVRSSSVTLKIQVYCANPGSRQSNAARSYMEYTTPAINLPESYMTASQIERHI
jgi:hypothetical protein